MKISMLILDGVKQFQTLYSDKLVFDRLPLKNN